jgi:hypothetical protein
MASRDIEMALRRAGKGYVLGVKSNDPFHSWDKPQRVAGTAVKSLTVCRLPLGDGRRWREGRALARLVFSRTRRS